MAPRPLPVIAGTVRCSVIGTTASGQPWVNVVHFQYALGASNPGPIEITTLDASFFRFYSGAAYGSGQAVLNHSRLTITMSQINYTPLDGTSNTITKTHSVAGTHTDTKMPPNEVSQVLTLRTNTRGRRYRGRIYLPTFVETYYDGNGAFTASVAQEIIDQWTGMASALSSSQWLPVVASYGHSVLKDGTISTWTPFATPVTTVTMDLKGDVQRRRK